MAIEVPMPQMGESVAEGTIVRWLKKVGDSVKVSFDLRGREYQDRYFVNLNAWKIEGTGDNTGENNSSDVSPPFDPADEILDEEPPF